MMQILPTLAPFLSHVFQFVVAHILDRKREYVSILVNTVMYLAHRNTTHPVHSKIRSAQTLIERMSE